MKLVFTMFAAVFFMSTAIAQNVGIGTTTPVNKLSVVGKVNITDSLGVGTTTPASVLHLQSANVSDTSRGDIILSRYWNNNTDTRASSIFHYFNSVTNSDNLAFGVSGNGSSNNRPNSIGQVKMTIQANGNTGIGTISPSNKLSVSGNADISGNLGIGTASPLNKLSVNGNTDIAGNLKVVNPGFGISALSGGINNTSIGIGRVAIEGSLNIASNFNEFFVGAAPGDIALRTETTGQRLVLNSGAGAPALTVLNGNVGVGTISPASRFSVSGNSDISGNLGIGTTTPTQKLDVAGTTRTTSLQITNGAASGFILKSDPSGNASWANVNTLISETDPKVGTLTSNKIPKWNGTTLADGLLFDNGTNIGIGTITPSKKLTVVNPLSIGIAELSGSPTSNTSIGIGRTDVEGTLNIAGNTNEFANGTLPGDIVLRTESNTQRLILNSGNGAAALTILNGNTGIGTTTPGNKLSVNGNSDISGNLGIGTTTPVNKLSVVGKVNITDSLGVGTTIPASVLHLQSDNVSDTPRGDIILSRYWNNNTDTRASSIFHYFNSVTNSDNLAFGVAGNGGSGNRPNYISQIKMLIQANGNVGIGTISPSNKLSVNGNSDISGNLGIGTNTPTNKLSVNGNSDISGNLGIGTTTPSNKLSVNGNSDISGDLGIGTTNPAGELHVKSTAYSNSILDQQQTSYNGGRGFNTAWQSFTAGTTGFLTKVDLAISSSPASTGTIKIFSGEGNTGPLLSTTVVSFPEDDPYTIISSFPLNNSPSVVAGNKYTIEFSVPNGVQEISTSNPYPGGRSSYSATEDHFFKTYVATSSQVVDGLLVKNGKATVNSLQLVTGAASGFILKSDATGNATWVNANTLTVTETDPKIGTLTSNKIPKWNGTTLADGLMFDNGINVGVGTSTPANKLSVNGNSDISGNLGIGTTAPANKLSVNGNSDITGTLGIGTTAPAAKLHVASSSTGLRIDVPATQTAFSIGGAGSIKVDAIGVAGGRLLINDNGNMGLGNTNPITTLDVNGGIRTKYSGSTVVDVVGGVVTTLNITIPAVPADWNVDNTIVIVTNADGVDGIVRQAKLSSLTNIAVKYIQDINGLARFNWVIFRQ